MSFQDYTSLGLAVLAILLALLALIKSMERP